MTLSSASRSLLQRVAPGGYRRLSRTKRTAETLRVMRRAGLPLQSIIAAQRALLQARHYKMRPLLDGNPGQAVTYVGTTPEEGLAQLAVLIAEGCQPHHKVLEIGCGALNAGYPILQYLNRGGYCGVDPNRWLIEDALAIGDVGRVATEKSARFDYNDTFDGSAFKTQFDYVISHSVLSHAAHWQWPVFAVNVAKSLKSGGKAIASLHFVDGNPYGGPCHDGTELDFATWQYPGISAFRRDTILDVAAKNGLSVRVELTAAMLIRQANAGAVHSWVVLQKT